MTENIKMALASGNVQWFCTGILYSIFVSTNFHKIADNIKIRAAMFNGLAH
jgi:hypothetical protein